MQTVYINHNQSLAGCIDASVAFIYSTRVLGKYVAQGGVW